jgi:hypothetical protein
MNHLNDMCERYLDAKKTYVEQLNMVIAKNTDLCNDIMNKNKFDRADKSINNIIVRALSESSKNLERVFWADRRIDHHDRMKIANEILLPSDDRDAYIVKPPPSSGGFPFLLIRNYDLPFIRYYLRMALRWSGKAYTLVTSDVFNEILEIDGDKFVLHSGVRLGIPKFKTLFEKVKKSEEESSEEEGFGKGDRAQHCPLIVSLIRLMDQHHIPYDSNRPVVQHCLHQQETEVDFATVPVSNDDDTELLTLIDDVDEDGGFVHVPSNTSLSAAPPLPKDWRHTFDPVTKTPLWVNDRSGTVMYEPPPTEGATEPPPTEGATDSPSVVKAQVSLNTAWPNREWGGRRTKNRKLSKRVARIRRTRRTRRTRKSIRTRKSLKH